MANPSSVSSYQDDQYLKDLATQARQGYLHCEVEVKGAKDLINVLIAKVPDHQADKEYWT